MGSQGPKKMRIVAFPYEKDERWGVAACGMQDSLATSSPCLEIVYKDHAYPLSRVASVLQTNPSHECKKHEAIQAQNTRVRALTPLIHTVE